MHEAAYAVIAGLAAVCGPWEGRRVIEVGARDINGSIRPCFPGADYSGIDRVAGRGVDVVIDARAHWPAPVAAVVCCEVLEHDGGAGELVAHLAQWLEPGGWLFLTAAGPRRAPHSAIDGGRLRPGEHYRGIGVAELEAWLAGAGLVGRAFSGLVPGVDVYALACRPWPARRIVAGHWPEIGGPS